MKLAQPVQTERGTRAALAAGLALLLFVLVPSAGANTCEWGEAPDVIVGALTDVSRYPSASPHHLNGITSFAIGTTSCNIGSCWLRWDANEAEHPVIGQTLFRLKNGRFEQLGQSWLKHGFTALQGSVCATAQNPCTPSGTGTRLGVFCSDPYGSGLNGDQTGLGPKHQVNASTGVYAFPYFMQGQTGDSIYKRLQVRITDLDPGQNAGALYWIEGQYVTHDDAEAGNQKNNASYRKVTVTGTAGSENYNLSLSGAPATVQGQCAIHAWKAVDSSVVETDLDTDDGGRVIVAAKATSLGGGVYHYEYAVHNMNSDRSIRSFTVPLPAGAIITNIGFHDVDYHSGEPYDGADWLATVGSSSITWATQTFAQNPNANALRWGTLYNFRFDADVAPATNNVTLGAFKPGGPGSWAVATVTPNLCNGNGTCDPGETCANCAVDCAGQGGGPGCCGNSTCEPGENPCRCAVDCAPQRPSELSCANGIDEDCDGLTDCADIECCTAASCAGGPSDPDNDGYSACDCDNANGAVWATPGPVKDVSLTQGAGETLLNWIPPDLPGGSPLAYDILRSMEPDDFVTDATCVLTLVPSTSDTSTPSPGGVYSYLIRATNACPQGEGSLGTASNGTPRAGRSCP